LVEKAYAKLSGTYETVGSGGWPSEALRALTGSPGFMYDNVQYEGQQIWELMHAGRTRKDGNVSVLTASTEGTDTET